MPKSTIVDLGIQYNSNFNFSSHINSMVRKSSCSGFTTLRCFYSKEPRLIFKAFTTYIRPILEYCSSLWSPYKLCEIRKIESVQRKFTKRLRGLKNLPYTKKLKILKSETLELRRLKTDLIMIYKIMHGFVSIPLDSFFPMKANQKTKGHSLTITGTLFRCNREKYSFKNRCIDT